MVTKNGLSVATIIELGNGLTKRFDSQIWLALKLVQQSALNFIMDISMHFLIKPRLRLKK